MARPPKTTRLKALATYKLLAARARVVLGTAKLQSSTVNALARVAAMAAVGKGAVLSVSVKASLLLADVKTGKFFTLLNVEDAFTATEVRNFNVSKLRVSETQAVDRALVELFKVLSDAAHVADQVDRVVSKSLTNTTLTTELVTRDSSKLLADVASTSDEANKGFETTRQETVSSGDDHAVQFDKHATDTAVTVDLFDRTVAFVRFFSDEADATDEINANLLTDDGQVVFLSKVVLDTATTATQIAFDMSRVQADTAAVSDEALLSAAKQLDDLIGVTDFSDVEFGAARSDDVLTTETTVFDTARVSQDTAALSTTTARDFFKALYDEVTVSDSMSLFFEAYYNSGVVTSEEVEVVRIAAGGVPPQNDNQIASDTAALGVSKEFAEVVGVTDDFFGNANIDDDQITFVGKNLTENLALAELRTVALQRTLQESVNAGSSGLLAMTDYCDSTYFSQAYVGTERIFS